MTRGGDVALCSRAAFSPSIRSADAGLLSVDREEGAVGFLDKAKQVAAQAQKKLEETQEQLNRSQGQAGAGSQSPPAAGTRYDQHGRPLPPDGAPPVVPGAGATTPADRPAAGAAPPAHGDVEETPQDPKRGVNQNPDPFRPIQ
jgi:hypothetical protein